MDLFILYVFDVDCEGFLQTLTLMMCISCSYSVSNLMRGFVGGSIRACTSALSHWKFFTMDVLVSVYGVAYVKYSDFAK